MSNGNPPPECPTGSCGYGILAGKGDCNGGDSSCANAHFLAAMQSEYHTARLIALTNEINGVLDNLGQDPSGQGRKLSLLRTPRGVTLGWLRHGPHSSSPDAKQARADDPRVISELMIDDEGTAENFCGPERCDYRMSTDGIICHPGEGATCWPAVFLEAAESPYHPASVRQAVRQIKDMVSGVQDEANGRRLAILRTPAGMMLAWVWPDGGYKTA